MKRLDIFHWEGIIEIYGNSISYTERSNIYLSGNKSCKRKNHVLGETGRKGQFYPILS